MTRELWQDGRKTSRSQEIDVNFHEETVSGGVCVCGWSVCVRVWGVCGVRVCVTVFLLSINLLGFLTLSMVKGGITRDAFTPKSRALWVSPFFQFLGCFPRFYFFDFFKLFLDLTLLTFSLFLKLFELFLPPTHKLS